MKTILSTTLRRAFELARQTHLHPELSYDDLLDERRQQVLSRRQFLHSAGRAGLVLGVGSALGGPLMPLLDGRGKPNIAIVGAGLGGLSAGYFLRRKGVAATLFEADKRPGGRVKSARPFADGRLNTEIGAEFIDTHHGDLLWLVRMLRLDGALMDVEDDRFGVRDAFFLENRHHSLQEVVTELAAVYPRIEADRKALDGRRAAEIDRRSMAEYIDALTVSEWVKKMLHAAFVGENGLETAEQSAANLLYIFSLEQEKNVFKPFGWSDERFKVIGGNEQIPQGLARILEGQIRYEHRLTALRENANGSITLVFEENGTTREATFDAVVLTLPFTVLREVDIQMELPPLKRQVIRELGYGTNAKFILETRDRPWRNAGYRGYLFNERISNGWDSAQMQLDNAGPGSFTCFFGGKRGLEARRGAEADQLAYVLPQLDGAFPGASKSLTGRHELAAWPSNPFVRASYSCFRPGQALPFEGAAFTPVRRLFFAGEHCSTEYWGFMNGAAETGRKAAEKLLKKMRVR